MSGSSASGRGAREVVPEFGRRVRVYREALGLTCAELARLVHPSYGPARVWNWELSRRNPSLPDLVRLANALNVHVDDLVSKEDAIESTR